MRALALPALLLSLAAAAIPAVPPPLDHAPLLRARAVTSLTPDEPVVGIEIGGDARAYPLRLLAAHAVANETIDRHPVAIVYCRPCGSVLAYRTDTPKGTLILAASGRYRDATSSSSTAAPARSGSSSPARRWRGRWPSPASSSSPCPWC